jgi:non-specific serine/threonine protein kinase
MKPERFQQVEKLYHACLDHPALERLGFLEEACGGDTELFREVQSLLASRDQENGLLDVSAVNLAAELISQNPGTRPDWLGRTVLHYRIEEKIGEGAMGVVYRAHDTKLGRKVAIKFLPEVLAGNPRQLERFEREARVLAALNHPNIGGIYAIEEEAATRYLVLELVPGDTLAERLCSHAFAVDEALRISSQIAEALEAAHQKGIIHKDLKPANIKVTPENRIKVLDFGIAKYLARSTEDLELDRRDVKEAVTTEGVILGTLPYMSPEQARGKPLDKRTDIWSFGCVLYELLARRRPFEGDTIADITAAVLARDPDWSVLPNSVPKGIRLLLARCLEKDVSCRLDDIAAARKEIEEALASPRHDPEPSAGIPGVRVVDSGRRTSGRRAHNLPAPPNSFIGREKQKAQVLALLVQPDVRLITLTGPGGSGKTRLAIEIARESIEAFRDGVFFIPLAAINDPGLVLPTIAHTIGVKDFTAESLAGKVQEYLGSKKMLLAIDNFEQVLAAASELSPLLASAPFLKLLVTSRTPLHLYGEHEFVVPPFDLPDTKRVPPLETLVRYEAIRLFNERAQAAKHDFELTHDNAKAVVEICYRLDGLPLAIELAAARIKTFTPATLLEHLSSPLRLLTGGARDLPARQQTLRNTIEWSYGLLSRAEQEIFARVGVFAGGCTIDAAAAVCSTGENAIEVSDGLASLLDHNLLRQEQGPGGAPRYMMLETVREYAREQLEGIGPSGVRARHAGWFLHLAEEVEPQLYGPDQAVWFNRLQADHDNFRAALEWFREMQATEEGLRLALGLYWFWNLRSHSAEGRKWLEYFAAVGRHGSTNVIARRALALSAAAHLAWLHRDISGARVLLEESIPFLRQLSDRSGLGFALNWMALVTCFQGDRQASLEHGQEAIALLRTTGDKRRLGHALFWSGIMGTALGNASAKASFEESRMLATDVGDRWTFRASSAMLGKIAYDEGDLKKARALLEESRMWSRELGSSRSYGLECENLALITWREGAYYEASELYVEAVTLCNEIGNKEDVALCLAGLAGIAQDQGRLNRAARLYGAAEALLEAIAVRIYTPVWGAEYEQAIRSARRLLDPAAWSAGRALSLDEAIAYARDFDNDGEPAKL